MKKVELSAALLLTIGICLQASVMGSPMDGHWLKGSNVESRLSRSLVESDVPKYLIPTRLPTICSGGSCCNADWQASPYWLQHLNSTVQTVGQQQYTTFYLNLLSNSEQCRSSPDAGDCCSFNINKLWLDVDPKQKVEYVSLNGQTTNFLAVQDNDGFNLVPANGALLSLPASGILITVTVVGAAKQLCPTPDFTLGAPVTGVCQVIVLGYPAYGSRACCPYGLAKPENPEEPYYPVAPSCSSAISSSPYSLQLQSVSAPFASSGSTLVTYSFALYSNGAQCDPAAINECCGMPLDSLDIDLVSTAVVSSVTLGGSAWSGVVYGPSNAGPGFTTMTMQRLGITSGSVPAAGTSIVLTIKLSSGATLVPDICKTGAAGSTVGHCTYSLHAPAGTSMCCPTDATDAVKPGQPHPATCSPTQQVPIKDTSMGFNYYDGPINTTGTATTKFTFMVYNQATCTTAYCQAVCNWELFVDPALTPLLSFEFDDPSGNGMQTINPTTGSVVFTNVPAGSTPIFYTVVVKKAGVTLAQLCNSAAVPGQSKACASILRNTAVLSTVFFNQSDAVVTPGPVPTDCNTVLPLAKSCVRVDEAGYNSPTGSSTVLDFKVVNHDGEAGCIPDESVMKFEVLLQKPIVSELRESNALVPTSVVFGSDGTSITWSWTPVIAGDFLHYQLDVSGNKTPAAICQQNVVPNQAPNSCVVVFIGTSTCYMGPVIVVDDHNLEPITPTPTTTGSKSNAGIIIMAVIIPIAVLALALALFAVLRRRRQRFNSAAEGAAGDDLAAPLSGGSAAGSAANMSQASERSGSDIHVRLPSSTAARM